jgi:hypothetical protein
MDETRGRDKQELPSSQTWSLTSWDPVSPASSRWQRAADRYLAGWQAVAGGYRVLVLVAAASLVGWPLPDRLAMLPMAVLVLAVGLGCAIGFARCRTAHCVITAAGLTPVGLLMMTQVVTESSWLGFYTWLGVAFAIIIVGFAFETAWSRRHGGGRVVGRN